MVAAEYGAKHGLNPATLTWWSSAMKRAARKQRPRSTKRQGAPSQQAISFLPLRVVRGPKPGADHQAFRAEVVLARGRRLRLGRLTADQLAAVVAALEGGE